MGRGFVPAAAIASLLTACGGPVEIAAEPVPTGETRIISFFAEPSLIESGGRSTLSWSVENASHCEIARGGPVRLPAGSVNVAPTKSTTYLLTCDGDRLVQAEAKVRLRGEAPAPTAVRSGTGGFASRSASMLPDGSGWFAGVGLIEGNGHVATADSVVHVDRSGAIDLLVDLPGVRTYGSSRITHLFARPDGGAVAFITFSGVTPHEIGGETFSERGTLLVLIGADGSVAARFLFQERPQLRATMAPDGSVYLAWVFSTREQIVGGQAFKTDDARSIHALLIKLGPDLEIEWARSMGGACTTRPAALAADISGVVITGVFSDASTFGTETIRAGKRDATFVARWSAIGDLEWARSSAKSGEVIPNGCEHSPKDGGQAVGIGGDGSVWLTATSWLDFHLGDGRVLEYRWPKEHEPSRYPGQVVVVRYAADGTPIAGFRSVSLDGASNASFLGLAPRGDGGVLALGWCTGASIWVGDEVVSPHGDEACAVEFAPDVTPVWARRIGGGLGSTTVPMAFSASPEAIHFAIHSTGEELRFSEDPTKPGRFLGSGKGLWRLKFGL